MIRRLSGSVITADLHSVIIRLGAAPGLCLEVRVPNPQIPELAIGSTATLFTHLYVRPEEMSLFGFLSEEDYRIFMQLIRVSGLGPRAAVGMLGAISPAELVRAILHNDPKVLARAPGIGPRTAKKIILDLADRIAEISSFPEGFKPPTDEDADILAALTQMGFSTVEASKALDQVPSEVEDEGERLRLALQNLG